MNSQAIGKVVRSRSGAGAAGLLVLIAVCGAVLVGGSSQPGSAAFYATVGPSGGDDAIVISQLLASGVRDITLEQGQYRMDTPVVLGAGEVAYDGVNIHGAGRGNTVLVSTIGRPAGDPTNPTQSVFFWHGGFNDETNLGADAVEGAMNITLNNTSGYVVGGQVQLIPDGSDSRSELRTITSIDGQLVGIDIPLEFDHGAGEFVWSASSIDHFSASDLTITGDAQAGIALSASVGAVVEAVDIIDWQGRVGINMDVAGHDNTIRDVSVVTVPGAPNPTLWGVSFESQLRSTMDNVRVRGALNGISINYSTAVSVVDSHASQGTIGIIVNRDHKGRPSRFVSIEGGFYDDNRAFGVLIGAVEDTKLTAVTVRRNRFSGVSVYPGARRTYIGDLRSYRNGAYGIGLENNTHDTVVLGGYSSLDAIAPIRTSASTTVTVDHYGALPRPLNAPIDTD